jgi:hypothetical protein
MTPVADLIVNCCCMRMTPIQIGLLIVVLVGVAWTVLRRSGLSRTESIRPSNIHLGPIRHQKLPQALEARIRKFEPVFAEVYPRTHDEWLDGFQRDADPEPEVAIWESMASAYQNFTARRLLSPEARKEAFGLLLVRSAADEQQTLAGAKLQHLSRVEAEELLRSYPGTPQPVLYEQR